MPIYNKKLLCTPIFVVNPNIKSVLASLFKNIKINLAVIKLMNIFVNSGEII
jgi:hypothetical protein